MDDPRAAQLLDFIRDYLLAERDVLVTVDTPLLTERLIDSVGVALLAARVEEDLGVVFDATTMGVGRVESVREILAVVDRR